MDERRQTSTPVHRPKAKSRRPRHGLNHAHWHPASLLLALAFSSTISEVSSRSLWEPIIDRDRLISGAGGEVEVRRERWRRADVPDAGFFDPNESGGNMLTSIPVTYPMGLGEPINTIISAHSDSAVLEDSEENGGLRNYFQSIGFGGECLGQHSGSDQAANLGDGNGYLNETAVMRWDYGDPALGTCTETIKGGNHFRYWRQNGASANSGAYFLALSYEKPIAEQHDIVDNGYNLGRDWLVGNATQQTELIPTKNLTNTTTYSGESSAEGWTYRTDVVYVSGLLPNTSDGINHFQGFSTNACDGLVAVLTVSVSSRPQQSTSNSPHTYAVPFRISSSLPGFLSLLSTFAVFFLLL